MQYSLKKIAQMVGGRVIGNGNVIIEEVLIDSRKKANALGTLFCAIKGDQHDGHNYIEMLLGSGVNSFMVQHIPTHLEDRDANYILVEDVLKAIQRFAKNHREQFTYPIVGITGSNGKTIVKEWCYQLLYPQLKVARNPRSYNSQIGVPISVLDLQPGHEIGLFEAGISQVGEMAKLQQIIQPTIGIFTNIGDAHAAGFLNETEKIYQKLTLFEKSKSLIFRREENLLSDIIDRFCKERNITAYDWSDTLPAFFRIQKIEHLDKGATVTGICKDHKVAVQLPFNDDTSIENSLHALTLALALDLNLDSVSQQLINLQPIEMRLNQKAGIRNCSIISDFYNSDYKSIEIVLDWAEQRHAKKKKTIVLSDLEQSSLSDRDLYTIINQLLKKFQYHRLIGIGPKISEYKFLFDLDEQDFYASTDKYIDAFKSSDYRDEVIVLKGARSFAFERIEYLLQQKVHNTVLEVNLNALQNNLNHFRTLAGKETRIMVMAKAFSYGSGGDEIAHFLQFNKVDYLGVAYADEGVELRKKGIHLPIMVMNSDEDSYDVMLDHNLEPELYSFRSLKLFAERVKQKAVKQAKAHIEVNTGMNRLGFDLDEMAQVFETLKATPDIKIQSIFSHFAVAEDEKQDDFTQHQIDQLNAFYLGFVQHFGYRPLKHIANSSGAMRFKQAHFDMIRLGIGLYGFEALVNHRKGIEPISTLKSFVSQIRSVKAGQGVSYGLGGKSSSDRKIAVVAIGYADGLNRQLSDGKGYFLINGKEAPIVGKICMDMTMCDITDIDCQEGDEVIVFGKKPSITEIARRLNTIPYEVLTSVSERVKRIYSEE